MQKVKTKAKLKIDNNKLNSSITVDNDGSINFDCILEWGIEDNNSETKVYIKDSIAFNFFPPILQALLEFKGSIKEIFSFSEIELPQIAALYVDELGKRAQRSFGNKEKGTHAYFSFNYLEIHWKENPPNINRKAELYLNSAANFLFDKEFYTYTAERINNDVTSLQVKMESSYKSTYFPIGGFEILPAMNFYFPKENEEEIVVKKEPYLSVLLKEWESDSLEKLIRYCDILTRLLSAYTNRHIDFLKLNVFYNEVSLEIIRSLPFNYDYNAKNSMAYIANFSPAETFLSAFNFEILNEKFVMLNQLVNTKLLAYNSTGTTKFMMFFLIVDSIKDLTLTEEDKKGIHFKFKSEEDKIKFNSLIKEFFNKVKELLDDSENDAFNRKKNSIKKDLLMRNMKDQFDEFFIRVEINVLNEYQFDFDVAKEIRNDIFHGRILEEDKKLAMKEICKSMHLPKLADDLLFSFFGAKPENIRDRQSN